MTETPSNECFATEARILYRRHILLVEDEATVRNVTREALEMGGHRAR